MDFVQSGGRVVDPEGLLGSATRDTLESALERIDARGLAMRIAVLSSASGSHLQALMSSLYTTAPATLDEYALRVAPMAAALDLGIPVSSFHPLGASGGVYRWLLSRAVSGPPIVSGPAARLAAGPRGLYTLGMAARAVLQFGAAGAPSMTHSAASAPVLVVLPPTDGTGSGIVVGGTSAMVPRLLSTIIHVAYARLASALRGYRVTSSGRVLRDTRASIFSGPSPRPPTGGGASSTNGAAGSAGRSSDTLAEAPALSVLLDAHLRRLTTTVEGVQKWGRFVIVLGVAAVGMAAWAVVTRRHRQATRELERRERMALEALTRNQRNLTASPTTVASPSGGAGSAEDEERDRCCVCLAEFRPVDANVALASAGSSASEADESGADAGVDVEAQVAQHPSSSSSGALRAPHRHRWVAQQCGHTLHLQCLRRMRETVAPHANGGGLRCPLCRAQDPALAAAVDIVVTTPPPLVAVLNAVGALRRFVSRRLFGAGGEEGEGNVPELELTEQARGQMLQLILFGLWRMALWATRRKTELEGWESAFLF